MTSINEFIPPEDKKGYGRFVPQKVRDINATGVPNNPRSKTPSGEEV